MGRKTTDATAFMSELDAAARMKPHYATNLMLVTVTALVGFFLFWASVSEIEEITRGEGQVVPSSEIQIVQSLEGGILAELLVAEGDLVEQGDVLMRISDIFFSSEERGVQARSWRLQAKRARLIGESSGIAPVIPDELAQHAAEIVENEMALYHSRQRELANAKAIFDDNIARAQAQIAETGAQIRRLENNRTLLNQELAITSEMVRQRAVPRLEEIRLQREVSDINGQLAANREKLVGLRAELSAAQKERADQEDRFRTQALGELNDVQTEIRQLEENLKSAEDRVFRTELRAPVTGIVNNVALRTIGGVVEPAQRLVEIVPVDDELKIIARVRPSDIAFLRPGQPVNVKISAYDPQIYGSLSGRLTRIGAGSITDHQGEPYFEIEARTERSHLGTDDYPLPITPGMVAETEIITGKRTIMTYLLKPVLRARERALRER